MTETAPDYDKLNRELDARIDATVEHVSDGIEHLKRDLATAKANEVYAAKLMLRFRTSLSNIKAGLEDEGDRVYFGSTNDADELREIIDAVEDLEWSRILASSQKKPDLYADLRELRASLKRCEFERDEHLRLKNELVLKAYPAMDAVDRLRALLDAQKYANDVVTVAQIRVALVGDH